MSATRTHTGGFDVCVVGGAGHVGLPLSIVFAARGLRVLIYDINERALETIERGLMPFMERGAEPMLRQALDRVSVKEAVAEVAAVTGTPRRDVYQRALALDKERGHGR